MSSRRTLNKSEVKTPNPAKRFLEWKSNDKSLSYYDKELGKNVLVSLPFKFQFLEEFHTIKGFNDSSQSGVYSNEVKFIGSEELKVSSHKGGEISTGIYKDIKLQIVEAGGKYHKSVYAVDSDGEIINISLKGAVVAAYGEFMNGNKQTGLKGHSNQIEGAWVEINKSEDKKKGATKYSVPVFSIGEKFTGEEMALANNSYLKVSEYYNRYSEKNINDIDVIVDNVEVEKIEQDGDLAF